MDVTVVVKLPLLKPYVNWLRRILNNQLRKVMCKHLNKCLEAVWNLFQLFIKNVFEDFYLFLEEHSGLCDE